MVQRIAVLITGSTRGIGFSMILSMAAHFTQSSNSGDFSFTYLVAGRSAKSVDSAVSQLKHSLHDEGVDVPDIQGVLMDVTDDKSIEAAVLDVQNRFGGLDVLVNNAGIAKIPAATLTEARVEYAEVLNTNVISVANVTTAFASMLQSGRRGLVINVSSARGSIERLSDPKSPKTISVPYSMSKVALNGLTLELAKQFDHIEFQIISPGHCKTELNGYRGLRDPREGAVVVTMLVERWLSERSECGFWETVGDRWELSQIPW